MRNLVTNPIDFPGPMIETRGLRRTFKGRAGLVEAVRGVDLRVERGAIFGFLGPNGAGKTTTLRMLTTLLPPTDGDATVAGIDLRRDPGEVRRRVGYVAQGGSTDPAVTARDEMILQARLYGLSRREAERRAAEVLAALEIESAADRPCGTYSGGMRRRLDLALGLVHEPTLLFLDEPTTGLDPQARVHLWEEIRKLRSNGTTVFMTTHYLDEADALCDRLAIIDQGTIVAEGTPDELKREVAGEIVTIGIEGLANELHRLLERLPFVREATVDDGALRVYVDRGESALPAILRALDGAGLAPDRIGLHRPSLDDVFLAKTGRSLRDQAAA